MTATAANPTERQWDAWEAHQCRLGTDRIAAALRFSVGGIPRDGRGVDDLELLDDAFGQLDPAGAQNVLGFLAGLR